jgi:hypothetical protein
VVRHIFQACPVWIYTQSNITSIHIYCLKTVHTVGCEMFVYM